MKYLSLRFLIPFGTPKSYRYAIFRRGFNHTEQLGLGVFTPCLHPEQDHQGELAQAANPLKIKPIQRKKKMRFMLRYFNLHHTPSGIPLATEGVVYRVRKRCHDFCRALS